MKMTPEDRMLTSFLGEKAEQCASNQMITSSKFLDMHEKSLAAGMRLPYGVRRLFYGGFEEAERSIAVYLPEYVEAVDCSSLSEFFENSPDDCPVSILEIKKDKFSKELTHRDYLGALMGLGINRDMTGDIMVSKDGCHIAVLKTMGAYISENLTSAGRGTHCAAVAPGAVGMAAGGGLVRRFAVLFIKIGQLFRKEEPAAETAAVAAHRTGAIFAEGDHRVFELLVAVRRIGEQPPGHRHRHHTVIGVVAALVEQREMVIFRVAELIDRAYGIPCKCAYHRFIAFELYLLRNFNAKIRRSFENAKFFVYFLRISGASAASRCQGPPPALDTQHPIRQAEKCAGRIH